MRRVNTNKQNQKGSAMLELALCIPMLVLMLIGAMDFSRAFFQSITLASAARAGASYGVSTTSAANDSAGIETRVLADTADLTGVTVTSTQSCSCDDSSSAGTSCSISSCSDGSAPRMFLKVTAAKTFTPMVSYVGMPGNIPLSQSVTFRIQ